MAYVPPGVTDPVPPVDRTLHATVRKSTGTMATKELRKSEHVPASLLGDCLPFVHLSVDKQQLMPFLRRSHYQRELFTLDVEGGETVQVMPQYVQYDAAWTLNPWSLNLRRWPRDSERHPVKLRVPIWFSHQDTLPAVKAGGYVHNMFGEGLECLVRDPANIPRLIVADMRRSVNGDLRLEHLDLPPGVTVRPKDGRTAEAGRKDPHALTNFLVGRVKRVRGLKKG